MRTSALVAAVATAATLLAQAASGAPGPGTTPRGAPDVGAYAWTEVTDDAPWGGRAGLQAVELGNRLYVLGGRTPRPPQFPPIPGDSDIWSDVWASDDLGATWRQVLPHGGADHWSPRAYFQALTKNGRMFVLGGQDFEVVPNPVPCPPFVPFCPPFVSQSDFFSDVWSSDDGVHWTELTDDAGWHGRAGLSAAVFRDELYVLGGSFNDDSSIVGGPPVRVYFNDVWRSRDGRTWTRVTESAPWAPRAGAVAAVKGGWLYVLGGERGFTCEPLPGCQPPYFNDVWRTRDGATWEQVTPAAGWSPRPGHQCVVLLDRFVCFGGFGLLANPMDVWTSTDGAAWEQVSDAPWNATGPDEVKYDFDVLVAQGGPGGLRPSIFTFGGDRETFDFSDPLNWLRVDDEVWRLSP